jgi:hypothetical protein
MHRRTTEEEREKMSWVFVGMAILFGAWFMLAPIIEVSLKGGGAAEDFAKWAFSLMIVSLVFRGLLPMSCVAAAVLTR